MILLRRGILLLLFGSEFVKMKLKVGKAGAAYTSHSVFSCNSSPERLGLVELGGVCVAVLGHPSSAEVDLCYLQAVVKRWSSL